MPVIVEGMKRKQQSREFLEKVVTGADSSGMTRGEYAASVGVGEAALSYWLTKLRGKRASSARAKESRLVSVRVVEDRVVERQELSLECAGIVVRFLAGTSPEYVGRLAASLRRC